jgi:hypothetical protein
MASNEMSVRRQLERKAEEAVAAVCFKELSRLLLREIKENIRITNTMADILTRCFQNVSHVLSVMFL